MIKLLFLFLWSLPAFSETPTPIKIEKLESRSFLRLNSPDGDLFKNHLLACSEGAGTRGGGDGRTQTLSDQANLVLKAREKMKSTLSSLDYDDQKSDELKSVFKLALKQGFPEEIEKSPVIILPSCRDENGEAPIVAEDSPNGAICVSQGGAAELASRPEIERVSTLIRVRLSQWMKTNIDPKAILEFGNWIITSGSPETPASEFALIRSEYHLSLSSPAPGISLDSWNCLEASPAGSVQTKFSEISPLVRSFRVDTKGNSLLRLEEGYAKCVGPSH